MGAGLSGELFDGTEQVPHFVTGRLLLPPPEQLPPLHRAALKGDLPALQRLLSSGMDVNLRAQHELTALHLAAYGKQAKAVGLLLSCPGVLVDAQNSTGITPLKLAAHFGSMECVVRLLVAGADPNLGDNDGRNACHTAAQENQPIILQRLLAAGGNPNQTSALARGFTPLMVATASGSVGCVRVLLTAGARATAATTDRGEQSIHFAAYGGHTEVLATLLDYKAPINARSACHDSPLLMAAYGGHLAAVRLLLNRGADKEATAVDGSTPLLAAAMGGHDECCAALLEAGADGVSPHDGDGMNPLHHAARTGCTRTVQLLLAAGAQKEAATRSRRETACHFSSFNGQLTCLKALIAGDCNIEARNIDGMTAVVMAAFNGHTHCVKALLDAGADITVRGHTGLDALGMAQGNGHTACAQVLRNAAASKRQAGSSAGGASAATARYQAPKSCSGGRSSNPAAAGAVSAAPRASNGPAPATPAATSSAPPATPQATAPSTQRKCAACGAAQRPDGGKLRVCAGCRRRWYCSQECAAAEWPTHRTACRQAQQ